MLDDDAASVYLKRLQGGGQASGGGNDGVDEGASSPAGRGGFPLLRPIPVAGPTMRVPPDLLKIEVPTSPSLPPPSEGSTAPPNVASEAPSNAALTSSPPWQATPIEWRPLVDAPPAPADPPTHASRPAPHAFTRSGSPEPAAPITGPSGVYQGSQGPIVIPTGNLPPTFASPGLVLLREGRYDKASTFYEERAQRLPADAHAWIGLGVACLMLGKSSQGLDFTCQGLSLDEGFPIGSLVEEARPGDPKLLFNLAQKFAARKDGPGYLAAISLIDTCLASPMTPQPLYMKADALRRGFREGLEAWNNRDNPQYQRMKRRASTQRSSLRLLRLVFYLFVTAIVAGGVVLWQQKMATERSEADGLARYAEAVRSSKAGSTKTQGLLCESWLALHKANQVTRDRVFPLLVELRCTESLINYRTVYKPHKGMPKKVKELEAHARSLEASLKALDGSGALTNAAETRLKDLVK